MIAPMTCVRCGQTSLTDHVRRWYIGFGRVTPPLCEICFVHNYPEHADWVPEDEKVEGP